MKFFIFIAVLAFSFPFFPKSSEASSCYRPTPYGDTAVNVYVLPYIYPEKSDKPVSAEGNNFSYLLRKQISSSVEKFDVSKAIQIKGDDKAEGSCDPNVVMRDLLNRRDKRIKAVNENPWIILLWGHIYEGRGGVHIQSFIHFERKKDATEMIPVKIEPETFFGTLPSRVIPFESQKLKNQDWEPLTIADQSARSKSEFQMSKKRIIAQLPELEFLEGLVGYLQHLVKVEQSKVPSQQEIRWTNNAFKEYEQRAHSEDSNFASAIAKVFRGTLKRKSLTENHPEFRDKLWDVHYLYREASRLAPNIIDISNLEIVTRFHLLQREIGSISHSSSQEILEDLRELVLLAPENNQVLSNLEAFLRLRRDLKKGEPNSGYDEVERAEKKKIFEQLRSINSIRIPDCRYFSATITGLPISSSEEYSLFFPSGDLFRPLFADPKEPRIILGHAWQQGSGPRLIDITFGGNIGIIRFRNKGLGSDPCDGLQLNVQGALFSQYKAQSDEADLLNLDYLLALPFTFRKGNFSIRFRYFFQVEHITDSLSPHDEVLPSKSVLSIERDLLFSHDFSFLRIYAGGGYILRKRPKEGLYKWQYGVEVRKRINAISSGNLSAWPTFLVFGSDFKHFQNNDYDVASSVKAGIEFFDPVSERRYATSLGYYNGSSSFGQFSPKVLETWRIELQIEL